MGQHLFRHGLRRATFPRGEGFATLNNSLSSVSSPGIVHPFLQTLKQKGVKTVKQDEKQPIPWEAKDPKPPVVHSGHLDGRKH